MAEYHVFGHDMRVAYVGEDTRLKWHDLLAFLSVKTHISPHPSVAADRTSVHLHTVRAFSDH